MNYSPVLRSLFPPFALSCKKKGVPAQLPVLWLTAHTGNGRET